MNINQYDSKLIFKFFRSGVPERNVGTALEQHKSLKRTSNIIGFSMITQFLSAQVIAVVFMLIIIPVIKYEAERYIPSLYEKFKPLTVNLSYLYMYITYMFIAFAVMAFLMKKHPLKDIGARRFEKPLLALPSIIFSLLAYSIGVIFTTLLAMYMSFIHLQTKPPEFEMPTQTGAMLVYLLMVCILAPLLEEFIFRGLVLQSLRKYGDYFAVAMSALLFALMHGNLIQIPFAFLTGLALGYFVIKLKTIWVSVIAHFLINSSSAVLDFVQKRTNENTANLTALYALGAVVLLSVLCLIVFRKTEIFKFKAERNESVLPSGFKFKTFITSAGLIIYFLTVIVSIVLTTQII